MGKITKFEDLDAWKKAREVTAEIYKLTTQDPFSRDFGLRDQIRRAAVSAMSHIAKGYGRGGNEELRRFLTYARGSATEVKSHLYVALDAGYIDNESFNQMYDLSDSSTRLIGGFIRYIDQSSDRSGES